MSSLATSGGTGAFSPAHKSLVENMNGGKTCWFYESGRECGRDLRWSNYSKHGKSQLGGRDERETKVEGFGEEGMEETKALAMGEMIKNWLAEMNV